MKTLVTFKTAIEMLKKDKVAILLSLLPVIIGFTILWLVSEWFFIEMKGRFLQQFTPKWDNPFLEGVAVTLLAVLYYVFPLTNFLFVLVVSIIASPFNDLLSARMARQLGESEKTDNASNFLKRWLKAWLNELKKIVFFGCLSLFSILLGFLFPPFMLLVVAFSSLLLAANFIDYSWSRQERPFSECLREVRKNFWSYGLSGFLFLSAFSLPIINIFLVPYAVIYYTILSLENSSCSS